MEIKVQITVKSEVGQPEVVREVARLERGSLRSETLGLSLAEARAILGGLEKTMAERQAAEFVEQGRRCPHCGRERACKGHHRIVFRTRLANYNWIARSCTAARADAKARRAPAR